jgi:hypothetical protein
MDAQVRTCVQDYCGDRPELILGSFTIAEVKKSRDGYCVFIETHDKRNPRLFILDNFSNGVPGQITPFFLIRQHENRQVVSYRLGHNLCNLAEVREIYGRLYSRYAASYTAGEVIHQDAVRSRIALWVQECLTEDFDHHKTLNRGEILCGAAILFDFGMSFSNTWFPPFFAWELGLEDDVIAANADFLIDHLALYALLLGEDEEKIISGIREAYPLTYRDGLCRYYLRNFAAYFPVRLLYGRFFEKLKDISAGDSARESLKTVAKGAGLSIEGLGGYRDFLKRLGARHRGRLSLRGLDLSGISLRRADLRGADLRECDVTGTDLSGADLRDADLRGARTGGMVLTDALTDEILF